MATEILGVSDRLLAAVLNGIYQGILVTVLVALSLRVFRRSNAATRHAIWLCTLVLLALLVVAHCFFRSRPAALEPGMIARTAATPEQEIDAPNVAAVAAQPNDVPTEPGESRPKWPGALPAELAQNAAQQPESISFTELSPEIQKLSVGSLPPPDATLRGDEPNGPSTGVEPLPASTAKSTWFHTAIRRLANPVSFTLDIESRAARFAGVILLGVCLMLSAVRLFMLLLRLHQIRKLKRQSLPPSEALNNLFQNLVARHGAGRRVDLKTLTATQSSFVLGFRHPVILLPAEPMEPAETESILRHELAHVRRRDDWANLLQHFILAAFPLHPAVWWISKQLSLEREIACDDYVLQSSAPPHAYALLLANLAARMQRSPPLLAPGASNNKTQLQQRIDMILNTRRNTSPRLAVKRLTFLASAAALFAGTAVCLAPRIVLAQSEAAPPAANTPSSPVAQSVQPAPAIASVAANFSPDASEPASSDAVLPVTPQPPAIPGPKLKPVPSSAANWQPAGLPPLIQAAPAAPAALAAPSVPRMPQGAITLAATPAPEPRPGRTPRFARAESADSGLEERLERLEKMVEALMARGYGTRNSYPYYLKPFPDTVGPVYRKEIEKIEADNKRHAEMALKRDMDVKEIEKIKEHAKREAARGADLAKRAAEDAERSARVEQKRQTKRVFKEGSQKQLDELRKRLEVLDREREKLEHQIEHLERNQEQQEEQEEQDSNAQSDASELNPDSPRRQ